MNKLENKEILPENIYKAIKKIKDKHPEAIFGGSIALTAMGLLNREIHDIDVFFDRRYSIDFDLFEKSNGSSSNVAYTDDNEKVTSILTSCKVNGVKCCVFLEKSEFLQYSTFSFFGEKIKISQVNLAIDVKRRYAKGGAIKHINDLKFIDKALTDLFNK